MANPSVGDTSASSGPGQWSDLARESLQLIADGVTELAGFGVAAISLARDDGQMQVIAVAGSDEARTQLEGVRTPVAKLQAELEKADDWGLFKFVPHERLDLGEEAWGWIPDMEPLEGEDAWHPLDFLAAPLMDDDGVLRGNVSIDLPVDGRRPGPAQRRVLERYAAQARRAVMMTLEREALAEQVRLAEAARRIVRRASTYRTLGEVLEACEASVVEGFRAHGMWIQTFEDGRGTGRVHSADGAEVVLPPLMVDLAETAATVGWTSQEAYVIERGRPPTLLAPEDAEAVFDFIEELGLHSMLFVPLGAGDECLGNLVLTRTAQQPTWSSTEAAAALDIGRDLGTTILNARAFEREHRLVTQLQDLDRYKNRLIATVAHELKNPIAAILGHVEMFDEEEVDPLTQRSLTAIGRAGRRLQRVVEDLLLFTKVGDPNTPIDAQPVDVRRIVDEVIDLVQFEASRKDHTLTVEAAPGALLARGDANELDRVVSNLVSNAVKYTPEGRSVTVRLARVGTELVIECSDEGFGISEEDREQLFTEFFRSTNPLAVAQPGTGLGLAIVKRIVDRHGGRIEVESTLGKGSTFRVFLPAAE